MVFLDLLGVVFLVTVFFDLAFNLPGDPGRVSFDFEDWDDFCNHYIYESCMNITVYTHMHIPQEQKEGCCPTRKGEMCMRIELTYIYIYIYYHDLLL